LFVLERARWSARPSASRLAFARAAAVTARARALPKAGLRSFRFTVERSRVGLRLPLRTPAQPCPGAWTYADSDRDEWVRSGSAHEALFKTAHDLKKALNHGASLTPCFA
jgi:hypothetical protein